MRPVLTPEEAAALDRGSEARGVTAGELMENAGRAVADAALDLAGGVYGRRVVVFCGKGNNGGDGLVAARHLDRRGARVAVSMLDEGSTPRETAASNLARLAGSGVRVRPYSEAAAERELSRADVAVDAIFGTGFRGVPEGDFASAIGALNASGVPVLAVDIPSGVNGANAEVAGEAVWASLTVTFGASKPGIVLFPGAARAGIVEIVDIGFPPELVTSSLLLVDGDDVARMLPSREPDTHKRATGVVLVVGGSRAMTGAICLAAEAAYRAGAGLVTVAVPEGILPVVESIIREATFLPLPETADGTIAAESLKVLWDRLGSFDAIALGPGMTTEEETAEFARSLIAAVPAGLVVDADALNALAGHLDVLDDRGGAEVVLTPHMGEFARVSGRTADEIRADPVGSVRRLAERAGSTVLLKGSRTLIGSPSGEVRVNVTGGPFLATAGTGDVLTGTIAALLGRGLSAMDSATAGAYVHGMAGALAAVVRGEGTTAGDVLAHLPEAIRGVGPA